MRVNPTFEKHAFSGAAGGRGCARAGEMKPIATRPVEIRTVEHKAARRIVVSSVTDVEAAYRKAKRADVTLDAWKPSRLRRARARTRASSGCTAWAPTAATSSRSSPS